MATCAFCVLAEGGDAHFVHEDPIAVAFLDRAPLIPGHVLVVPREHRETLEDVPADLLAALFRLVQHVSRAQREALGADGSLTMINTRVSQSVPHVHVHVVPRRAKDGLFRSGMVWIRRRYADGEAAEIAARLRAAISASG